MSPEGGKQGRRSAGPGNENAGLTPAFPGGKDGLAAPRGGRPPERTHAAGAEISGAWAGDTYKIHKRYKKHKRYKIHNMYKGSPGASSTARTGPPVSGRRRNGPSADRGQYPTSGAAWRTWTPSGRPCPALEPLPGTLCRSAAAAFVPEPGGRRWRGRPPGNRRSLGRAPLPRPGADAFRAAMLRPGAGRLPRRSEPGRSRSRARRPRVGKKLRTWVGLRYSA